jgi:hypothetical protein
MNKFLIAALSAMLALPAMAQDDSLKDLPGYIDFGEMSEYYGEPKVMINIGGSILRFVSGMASEDDPEAAAIMENLKGVRIQVYSTEGSDATPALDQASTMKGLLQAQNWEPIVQVNEDDEKAYIFIKLNADEMEGLAVMAVDDEEAVFINIIGMLDPNQLSQVMDNFDIDIDDHMELD